MSNGKIIVVMGGTSTEAEISRQTGTAILKALQSKGYNAEGMELHPQTFASEIAAAHPAIVFNALHGKFGEDGLIQGTLDMLGIPYTGSGVLAAAITMDKAASKRVFIAEGISTPKGQRLRQAPQWVHSPAWCVRASYCACSSGVRPSRPALSSSSLTLAMGMPTEQGEQWLQ